MFRGRIRRAVFGSGRWVRPPARGVVALSVALLVVATTELAFYRWATSSYEPARTVAAAGAVLRDPVRLDAALAVEWREAVAVSAGPGSWQRLLAPPLPPAICLDASWIRAAADTVLHSIGDAVRALDVAVRRGARRDELERRIAALREVGPLPAHGVGAFVVRYNLGRGYLATGDLATAAEVTEPIFDGFLSGERLPVTNAAAAERLLRGDGLSPEMAALGFHARFLAGAIAYRRGVVAESIKHFRLAINAVNYLVAPEAPAGLAAAHYERVVVETGGACESGRDEPLTSLDAYAALVAAYMAAPDFTDPSRLSPEVRRTRLQIDPDDPFRPVLRYARAVADRPAASPIPENLLWAASNLQRVYHYNRVSPEPRLAVTRAVLLLHLTADAVWVDALAASGDTDVCAMLGGVAKQLEREAATRTLARAPALATDSAQAAVALHTFARLETGCGRDLAPTVASDVRSAWLRTGRVFGGSELPGIYEEWRLVLQEAIRPSNASERVVVDAVAPVLERVHAHAAAFDRGRVPADLTASIRPEDGRRFVHAWRRAVFSDIADALADAGSTGVSTEVRTLSLAGAGLAGARNVDIPAGRALHFLASLNSAIAHAGMRPTQVYAPAELARIARSGGTRALLEYHVHYYVRGYRLYAVALLGGIFVAAAFLLGLLHVSWWRYRLLVDERLYVAERRSRPHARDQR